MRRHMHLSRRILSSVLLFFVLLVIFRGSAINAVCPAVSCTAPSGCIGACYSSVNIVPFLLIVLAAIVLPPVAFRFYRGVKYL